MEVDAARLDFWSMEPLQDWEQIAHGSDGVIYLHRSVF
eukprot:COSAG04_NODE_29250_length_270_cov_0.748538_1_plen_37_part_10